MKLCGYESKRACQHLHAYVRVRAWRAVREGTLVISRSRLMVLNLHRPIMAGIDYCSRRNHHGKLEPWAVTSIIESGGYEDDEDEGRGGQRVQCAQQ